MSNDIDSERFKVLLNCLKDIIGDFVEIPNPGEQKYIQEIGKFKNNEKFVTIINRSGHINKFKLTLVMSSKSSGIMTRFDIIGMPHNGIPTPHLHVFDSNHLEGRDVLYGELLPRVLQFDIKDNDVITLGIKQFLTYNNVDLQDVKIVYDFA